MSLAKSSCPTTARSSKFHRRRPAQPARQTRAVKEYLSGLEAEAELNPDRKPPKVISPSDPCSAWTAKANKRVQFGYGPTPPLTRSDRRLPNRGERWT